jgi:hypothetical protein
MSTPTRPERATLELRRNTSKHGFDVLRSSDKPPTCRSLVGACFEVSASQAHTLPTSLPISLIFQLVN